MKAQANLSRGSVDKNKVVIMFFLFATSIAIAASGAFFVVYSYLNQITFKVINTNVPGLVFGLVVAYLGVRYFLAAQKFKTQLYSPDAQFSWSNFRRTKNEKNR